LTTTDEIEPVASADAPDSKELGTALLGHRGRRLWAYRRTRMDIPDEQLTERARHGDRGAFGELYRRHHREARAAARRALRSTADADDVVSEAFAGVLNALNNGRGPRDNFRIYLLACVRNGCRRRRPVVADCDGESEDDSRKPVMFEDPERYAEADTVARAFASLAPRWQETLWLTDVQQWQAAEVGEQLRLSPNATAVLTRRARQAFAVAYLDQHVAAASSDECARFAPRLGAYVRDQLSDTQRTAVERHLLTCAECAAAAEQLRDLNASLRSLTPAVATTIGSGSGTSIATGVTTAGGTGTLTGLVGGGALVKGAALVLAISPIVFASDVNGHERGVGSNAEAVATVSVGASPIDDLPAMSAPTASTRAATPSTAVTTTPTTVMAMTPVNVVSMTSQTVPRVTVTSLIGTLERFAAVEAVQRRGDQIVGELVDSFVDDVSLNASSLVQTTSSRLSEVLRAGVRAMLGNSAGLATTPGVPIDTTLPALVVGPTVAEQILAPTPTTMPTVSPEPPPAATTGPAATVLPAVTASPLTVAAVTAPAASPPLLTVTAVSVPLLTVSAVTVPSVTASVELSPP
jgi:RNA polymerase sigma factor (sigma-70 family)